MTPALICTSALALACLAPLAHGGPALPASTGFIVELADAQPTDIAQKRIQSVLRQQQQPLQLRRTLSARWHVVDAPTAMDAVGAAALQQRLRADPRVRSVVPDCFCPEASVKW